MFQLLWRFVPGPVWLRIIVLLAAAAAIVYLLIAYVYPWAAQLLIVEESTVES